MRMISFRIFFLWKPFFVSHLLSLFVHSFFTPYAITDFPFGILFLSSSDPLTLTSGIQLMVNIRCIKEEWNPNITIFGWKEGKDDLHAFHFFPSWRSFSKDEDEVDGDGEDISLRWIFMRKSCCIIWFIKWKFVVFPSFQKTVICGNRLKCLNLTFVLTSRVWFIMKITENTTDTRWLS